MNQAVKTLPAAQATAFLQKIRAVKVKRAPGGGTLYKAPSPQGDIWIQATTIAPGSVKLILTRGVCPC